MPHLSDEIDEGATRRRLEEIAAAGMHGLDEYAERLDEIDREYREELARQEAEIKAMDELVAEARAKQEAEAAKQDESAPASPWLRRESKPNVMSFGGEELAPVTEPIPAAGALPPPGAALPVPVPPEPPPMPTPPSGERVNVLSLGYEDEPTAEQATAQPPAAPAARRPEPRPAPPVDDDDLSGHSWMR